MIHLVFSLQWIQSAILIYFRLVTVECCYSAILNCSDGLLDIYIYTHKNNYYSAGQTLPSYRGS